MRIPLLLSALLLLATSASIGGEPIAEELLSLLPEIEATVNTAKDNLWKEIEPNEPLWNFPPWLGTFFLSEYYFELKGIPGLTQP